MRSELELIEYLQKKEVEDTYIDEVIHRLKLEGLLDDAAFSEALVRTRIQTSAKGSQLIKKELVEKGIKNSLIEETLKQFTFEIQYEKVEKLARKKLNSSTKKSYRQQVDALKQTLLQKGFTFDVISEVVNNIEIDRDENDEYNAIVFQGEKLVSKYQKKESEFALKQKVKAGLYQKGFPADLINRFIDEYLNQAY
ncbi:regulatory protein recX [Gracilibacillus boraciitolerans JCM 21714]|uniref:Regulatory protein RecX n=2 Tax=Gracilibacillus boraciitolerans TaxID=307521 RepID=W4VPJ6_9BACI|nr:regulatory protein recX [Gracilibacillus boraciitolerans JCM 21714]